MKGFIEGLVWVTIIGQVPKVLGVEDAIGAIHFHETISDGVEAFLKTDADQPEKSAS